MLFSGDQFYESKSVDITDNRIKFRMKSIKELDESLEPPIDTAYKPINVTHYGIDLCLINVSNIVRDTGMDKGYQPFGGLIFTNHRGVYNCTLTPTPCPHSLGSEPDLGHMALDI